MEQRYSKFGYPLISQRAMDAVAAYRDTDKNLLDIAKEHGVHYNTILNHVKRLGINRHNWKRGYTINAQGYVMVCDGSHPYPHNKRQILEHVRIMELCLGRRLHEGEVVHHIDGNRTNNDFPNLQLMTNAEHSRYHRLLEAAQKLTAPQARCGEQEAASGGGGGRKRPARAERG